MNFERIKVCRELTPDDISKFENRYEIKLPDEYKSFLLKYNGVKMHNQCFDINDSDSSIMSEFFGIFCNNEYADIENIINIYKNRIPDYMMPIASDQLGNLVVISIYRKDFGKIYFWDHENEDLDNHFFLLADNFDIFLNNLYECEKNDEYMFDLINSDGIERIKKLLDEGYNIETLNDYNRSMIEEAVIAAKKDIIKLLHSKGAKKRNSIALAEQNAEFFDSHKEVLELIKKLYNS